MPYSILAKVKEWLPEVTTANQDTELNNLMTEVARDIDRIARQYTTLPILNTAVKDQLADPEAEWVAARWRKRRPYAVAPEANQYRYKAIEDEAEARVHSIFQSFYGGITDFVGTNRNIENDATRFMGPETR